ncbi:MAG: MATE family efflux transporter [Eubacteriales bacterium]
MNKDLTAGKPSSVLWKFCLPLFGSIVFQQMYNIADSFVAGRFIGNDALASVGNAYEITLLFIAFAFGCNIGVSLIVARFFGAKEYENVKTTVYTTFIASGVLCVALMAVGVIFCDGLLDIINTPAALKADSKLYLDIYILGLPFVFYYNISTGIFSALGDSRTPFVFLACSSVANIGADILLVTAFNMGVAGVAWATFICQGVSCVLAVLFVFSHMRKIETSGEVKRFSWPILKQIAVVAIPSILQQSFVSVGNIVIQSAINSFGSAVMAGYSAAVKLNNLVTTSIITVCNGISNFTSQNLGAKKLDRIKAGFSAGLNIVWAIALPIMVLYLFFGRYLVMAFLTDYSDSALQTGIDFLRVVSPFYPVVCLKIVSDAILRGTGKMQYFMITTFTDLLIRVILAFVLSSAMASVFGIWISWPVGWCVSAAMSVGFYLAGVWKKR